MTPLLIIALELPALVISRRGPFRQEEEEEEDEARTAPSPGAAEIIPCLEKSITVARRALIIRSQRAAAGRQLCDLVGRLGPGPLRRRRTRVSGIALGGGPFPRPLLVEQGPRKHRRSGNSGHGRAFSVRLRFWVCRGLDLHRAAADGSPRTKLLALNIGGYYVGYLA